MKDKELVQLAGRKPVTDSTFLVANASSLGFLPRPRFNAFPSCLLLCTAPATDSLLVLEVLFYTCPLSQLHCSANHLLWFFPFFCCFRTLPFLHFAMKYEAFGLF